MGRNRHRKIDWQDYYRAPATPGVASSPSQLDLLDQGNMEKTDWRGLVLLFAFMAVGATIGAFVFAPLYWPRRIDFALRCTGAAYGIMVVLFPGLLLLLVLEKLVAAVRRRMGSGGAVRQARERK